MESSLQRVRIRVEDGRAWKVYLMVTSTDCALTWVSSCFLSDTFP